MHIDYKEKFQSANSESLKCQNCTLEDLSLLREISNDPSITQKELATMIADYEIDVKLCAFTSREMTSAQNGFNKFIK